MFDNDYWWLTNYLRFCIWQSKLSSIGPSQGKQFCTVCNVVLHVINITEAEILLYCSHSVLWSLQRFPRKTIARVSLVQVFFYVSCIYLCILLSNTIFVSGGVRVVSLNSTTMGTTSEAGPAYRSTSPRFTHDV